MILIDDRTGSVELAPYIKQPHIVCRLDYADFSWSGNGPEGPVTIGVERKGLRDLLSSMTSGRLSGHQIIGLNKQYDWVYLLVEGVWRPDRRSGTLMSAGKKGWYPVQLGSRSFMAREVYNFLNTLRVMCGIIVIQTSNIWETGKWLDTTYGWWSKDWNKHKSHLQFRTPVVHAELTRPSLVTRLASQFDGIGMDKARKIGGHFTLSGFMSADESELTEIPGIGSKFAKSIIEQREDAE